MSSRPARQRPPASSPLSGTGPKLTPQVEQLRVGDAGAASSERRSRKDSDRVPFGTYLPADLHRRLKAACALHDLEIQQATERAIREWLERNPV